MTTKKKQGALRAAIRIARGVQRECEAAWNAAGGEEGSPEFPLPPPDQWARQAARYSGSGGADAAEEIVKRLKLAARQRPQKKSQKPSEQQP